MSWTTPGQGYFKSNLNESIQQIMRAYPRENINTISALRDIAGGRGSDEGRKADEIAKRFVDYMMNVSQTDKQLYAKYKKMNFKDLFKKNLNTFKKTKGGDVFKIKSGSLKEDAAAAAELKAKQATEAERLKDKQESENDALKLKHERENEQQKKKDESEKEAEKNQAARESVEEQDMGDKIGKLFKTKDKKEIDGIANLLNMTDVKVLQSMMRQNPKGFKRMAKKMGELPAMEDTGV